jgi:hypothetical protein
VNKIPPNFDTLFAISLEVIWLFKGVTAQRIYKSFGVKGLTTLQREPLPPYFSLKIETIVQNTGKILPDYKIHNQQKSNIHLWTDP